MSGDRILTVRVAAAQALTPEIRCLELVHREFTRFAQQGACIGRHLVEPVNDRTAARIDRNHPREVDEITHSAEGGVLGKGLADGFHGMHSEGNCFERP